MDGPNGATRRPAALTALCCLVALLSAALVYDTRGAPEAAANTGGETCSIISVGLQHCETATVAQHHTNYFEKTATTTEWEECTQGEPGCLCAFGVCLEQVTITTVIDTDTTDCTIPHSWHGHGSGCNYSPAGFTLASHTGFGPWHTSEYSCIDGYHWEGYGCHPDHSCTPPEILTGHDTCQLPPPPDCSAHHVTHYGDDAHVTHTHITAPFDGDGDGYPETCAMSEAVHTHSHHPHPHPAAPACVNHAETVWEFHNSDGSTGSSTIGPCAHSHTVPSTPTACGATTTYTYHDASGNDAEGTLYGPASHSHHSFGNHCASVNHATPEPACPTDNTEDVTVTWTASNGSPQSKTCPAQTVGCTQHAHHSFGDHCDDLDHATSKPPCPSHTAADVAITWTASDGSPQSEICPGHTHSAVPLCVAGQNDNVYTSYTYHDASGNDVATQVPGCVASGCSQHNHNSLDSHCASNSHTTTEPTCDSSNAGQTVNWIAAHYVEQTKTCPPDPPSTPPGVPTGLVVTCFGWQEPAGDYGDGYYTVFVSWDAQSGAGVVFELVGDLGYVGAAAQHTGVVAAVVVADPDDEDLEVLAPVTVEVRVRATSSGGTSAYSALAQDTCSPPPCPAAVPAAVAAEARARYGDLRWEGWLGAYDGTQAQIAQSAVPGGDQTLLPASLLSVIDGVPDSVVWLTEHGRDNGAPGVSWQSARDPESGCSWRLDEINVALRELLFTDAADLALADTESGGQWDYWAQAVDIWDDTSAQQQQYWAVWHDRGAYGGDGVPAGYGLPARCETSRGPARDSRDDCDISARCRASDVPEATFRGTPERANRTDPPPGCAWVVPREGYWEWWIEWELVPERDESCDQPDAACWVQIGRGISRFLKLTGPAGLIELNQPDDP